jgi:hypothetical protein
MNFNDDLNILFSDFGETAVVTAKTGETRQVILLLDSDFDDLHEGAFNTRLRTISATIPNSYLLKAGEVISVNGTSYDVISVEVGVNWLSKAALRAKP